jgi:hypothetical protein
MHKNTTSPLSAPPWSDCLPREELQITARSPAVTGVPGVLPVVTSGAA